ncbi:MAG: hypothetical protein RLZZ263_573 [Cyanobacteriota bacterium]
MPPRLLVLSNGHGEDLIALRVIQALHQRNPSLAVAVLPLVGSGDAYAAAEAAGLVQRIGPRQPLPSGGFSNQSLRGLARDLAAGLPALSWQQWQVVRAWGRRGDPVLAVGDLLPLLMAWLSGAPFGFIGTPKSDFTWASAPPAGWGRTPLADGYHRWKGSEWDPWEWALMGSRRCRLVAVRDRLTARGLRRHHIAAEAPGNPMMDGFPSQSPPAWLEGSPRLLLLPGSRFPEALGNAKGLLAALAQATSALQAAPLDASSPPWVLLACGSTPGPEIWSPLLLEAGWRRREPSPEALAIGASTAWELASNPGPSPAKPPQLLVGCGCFERWAPWADGALATAGTATEQVVGLGIPALSLPGPGPQFKAGFARRQSRLLGGAVMPCASPSQLAQRLVRLLNDPNQRHQLGAIGRSRMGPAGGSSALAALVDQRLLG